MSALLLLAGQLLAGCSTPAPMPAQPLFAEDQLGRADPREGVHDAGQSLVRMAEYFRARNKPQAAIAFYDRAVRQARDPEELVRLSGQLAELGAFEQAAAGYRRASELDPDNLDARIGLGMVLLRQGSVGFGADYFGRLDAEAEGKSLRLCNAHGAALDLSAEHEAAQAVYRRCLQIDPSDIDARSNLALSLALSRRFEEAVAVAKEIAGGEGATSRQQRNLILILALAGRVDEAWSIGRVKLGSNETSQIIDQAVAADLIDDPIERVRAIGFGQVAPTG